MSTKDQFAIAPWEHPGADFNPHPHAETTLKIGGRVRQLLLKARDGVIYFKEPHLEALWAIPRVFASFVDEADLVQTARLELQAENYGRYTARGKSMPWGFTHTNICAVRRANGSGIAKEWFEPDWREFQPTKRSSTLDLWESRLKLHTHTQRLNSRLENRFFNRCIESDWRRNVPVEWKRGSLSELARLTEVALKLMYPHQSAQRMSSGRDITFSYQAHSPNSSDSLVCSIPVSEGPPALQKVWRLLKTHFVFVGLTWERAYPGDFYNSPEATSAVEAQTERFGENWRGLWIQRSPVEQFSFPVYSPPTAHERLELALELGDWLRDKMPANQAEKLIGSCLES